LNNIPGDSDNKKLLPEFVTSVGELINTELKVGIGIFSGAYKRLKNKRL
jgi:hypothetical protein